MRSFLAKTLLNIKLLYTRLILKVGLINYINKFSLELRGGLLRVYSATSVTSPNKVRLNSELTPY